ncbi:MAG: hypothetical protein GYA63_02315, partial [Armatimonadetes bacterium]|nr:hypothetical protein [Armatimonadota bacterium]
MNVPYELMGWLGPAKEREAKDTLVRSGLLRAVGMEEARRSRLITAPDPVTARPVWELAKEVLGREYAAGKQEVGDCVSWGMKQAGEIRSIIEIASGQEERFRRWFAPWIYATSRNQIGGGLNGDGSLGVWAAAAVSKYGILFEDDEGVPPYSGSVARSWGNARNVRDPEYGKFMPTASDNPCVCVEVESVEEAVAMIRDYRRPLTIASSRGFKMEPRVVKGKLVFTPSGTWMHQMCFVEYDPELPALYRLNSWGTDAHGRPLNGEIAGGAW